MLYSACWFTCLFHRLNRFPLCMDNLSKCMNDQRIKACTLFSLCHEHNQEYLGASWYSSLETSSECASQRTSLSRRMASDVLGLYAVQLSRNWYRSTGADSTHPEWSLKYYTNESVLLRVVKLLVRTVIDKTRSSAVAEKQFSFRYAVWSRTRLWTLVHDQVHVTQQLSRHVEIKAMGCGPGRKLVWGPG